MDDGDGVGEQALWLPTGVSMSVRECPIHQGKFETDPFSKARTPIERHESTCTDGWKAFVLDNNVRVGCTDGWKAFVLDNNVRVGDLVIFSLISFSRFIECIHRKEPVAIPVRIVHTNRRCDPEQGQKITSGLHSKREPGPIDQLVSLVRADHTTGFSTVCGDSGPSVHECPGRILVARSPSAAKSCDLTARSERARP